MSDYQQRLRATTTRAVWRGAWQAERLIRRGWAARSPEYHASTLCTLAWRTMFDRRYRQVESITQQALEGWVSAAAALRYLREAREHRALRADLRLTPCRTPRRLP